MAAPKTSLRLWILLVAAASFAAGAIAGIALPELLAARGELNHDERYVRDLASKYGLTAAQQRSLRIVLREDERQEMAILKGADWDALPQGLRSERLAQKRRTEQRIRFVLDERQRALYDRDSRPLVTPGAARDPQQNR